MTLEAKWFPSKPPFGAYMEARCGRRGCCTTLLLNDRLRDSMALGRGIVQPRRQGKMPAFEEAWRFTDRVVGEWRAWTARGGTWRAFYHHIVEGAGDRHVARDGQPLNLAVGLPARITCPLCGFVNDVPFAPWFPPPALGEGIDFP